MASAAEDSPWRQQPRHRPRVGSRRASEERARERNLFARASGDLRVAASCRTRLNAASACDLAASVGMRLESVSASIARKGGEDDKPVGSVSSRDIAADYYGDYTSDETAADETAESDEESSDSDSDEESSDSESDSNEDKDKDSDSDKYKYKYACKYKYKYACKSSDKPSDEPKDKPKDDKQTDQKYSVNCISTLYYDTDDESEDERQIVNLENLDPNQRYIWY